MAKNVIKIEGVENIQKAIAKNIVNVRHYLGIAVDGSSEATENYMRQACPVSEGKLKASIRKKREDSKSQSKIVDQIIAGNDEVDYALAVEFGNRTRSAHPFARKSLQANKKLAKERVEAAIRKSIKG